MTATQTKKKAAAAAQKPHAGGMGLDSLGDLAGLLNEPQAANTGVAGPQDLPLELIDEDPNQPRKEDNPGFSPESIAEIGQTIKDRGVKSPISVRENPDAPGRYLINHGARRFSARSGRKRRPFRGSSTTTTTTTIKSSRTCNATS